MSASDVRSSIQFQQDKTDREHKDKAAEYDALGADEDANFGFSGVDPADYQYERTGKKKTETRAKREVF